VTLHVDLWAKPNVGSALRKTFRDVFYPAISAQPGFVKSALLRTDPETDLYRLVITFESEDLRVKWVATDVHQQVWPQMEAHCARYDAKIFEAV
jgi:heme-degrading monooxygenase HmoA